MFGRVLRNCMLSEGQPYEELNIHIDNTNKHCSLLHCQILLSNLVLLYVSTTNHLIKHCITSYADRCKWDRLLVAMVMEKPV